MVTAESEPLPPNSAAHNQQKYGARSTGSRARGTGKDRAPATGRRWSCQRWLMGSEPFRPPPRPVLSNRVHDASEEAASAPRQNRYILRVDYVRRGFALSREADRGDVSTRLVSTRLELGRGPCRISTRVDSQARSNMDARARYGRRQAPRAAGAASDRHTAHRTLIRLSPAVISLKVNIHDGITRR